MAGRQVIGVWLDARINSGDDGSINRGIIVENRYIANGQKDNGCMDRSITSLYIYRWMLGIYMYIKDKNVQMDEYTVRQSDMCTCIRKLVGRKSGGWMDRWMDE